MGEQELLQAVVGVTHESPLRLEINHCWKGLIHNRRRGRHRGLPIRMIGLQDIAKIAVFAVFAVFQSSRSSQHIYPYCEMGAKIKIALERKDRKRFILSLAHF